MLKKLLLLTMGLLVVLFTASGCLDLFTVPGVALSPDGSTLYFLAGEFDMTSSGEFVASLTALNISDGSTTVVAAGDDSTLITAFAVNPVDGTVVYVRSQEGGSFTIELSGGSNATLVELPVNTIGTQAAFSPDGAWLAVTVVTLPEDLDTDDVSDLTPDQLASISNDVYLVEVATGAAQVINEDSRANTVAWSPDGMLLAYNAWVDTNGDGRIQAAPLFDMGSMMGAGGTDAPEPDLSQLFIYNVSDGSTTQVESDAMDFAPAFIAADRIAYVTFNLAGMMTGDLPGIAVYDIGSGDSEQVYQTQALVMGMALSPDGSQVAWTQSGSGTGSEDSPPGELYITDTEFEDPQLVATLENITLPDAPVWWDDSTVLVAASNIINGLAGSITASFSFSTDGESSSEVTSDIPPQQILAVNVEDGSAEVVYEGAMLNPSFVTSLLSLLDMGGMEEMMGGLGQ